MMKTMKGNWIARILAAGLLSMTIQPWLRAQVGGVIDAGTTITVRTSQDLTSTSTEGRLCRGVVDQDVIKRRGSVAIPRGSGVQLVVRDIGNNQVALDMDSVTINGQQYGIETDQSSSITSERKEGIGVNKRTG